MIQLIIDGVTKKAYIDAFGFLRIQDNRISRIGVQEYEQPDGTIRRELRLPEEVEKSIQTFNLIPAVLFHPDDEIVTSDSAAEQIIGFFGNLKYADGFGWGEVAITGRNAINAVIHGIKELSCGYSRDLEKVSGIWVDELGLVGAAGASYKYDCIQRNIKINHVALVPHGRAGEKVALNLDEADQEKTELLEINQVENMDEVLTAIAQLTTLVTAMQTQIADSVTEEIAPETAVEVDNSAVIEKEVTIRLDCWSKVTKLLPDVVIDSKLSSKQIKVNAIAKLNPELAANLDNADEAYIDGMFAVLSAAKPEVAAPVLPEITTEVATDSTTSLRQSLNDSRAEMSANSSSKQITAKRKARTL